MNKILLIIQREYLTRVKKKSFIIMTFLTPLLIAGIYGLIGYFTYKGIKDTSDKIAVVSENSSLQDQLLSGGNISYSYFNGNLDKAKSALKENDFDYVLHIPEFNINKPTNIQLFGYKQASITLENRISRDLESLIKNQKLRLSGISQSQLDALSTDVDVEIIKIGDSGTEKGSSAGASAIIGGSIGIFMFIFIMLYGVQVMRGVIEEKTNRIIEVMISSVKPFQLMMGKIIGIGLVSLTQFLLWIILTTSLSGVAVGIFAEKNKAKPKVEMSSNPEVNAQIQAELDKSSANPVLDIQKSLSGIPMGKIVTLFLFYFLFGYLFYSALYAAIGSAVDNETETQQFMMPVMLPLFFSYFLSLTVVNNDPYGTLAYWLSIIPFTSPIAMAVRIPYGVPTWELALSMGLLILGFIFTTWLAGRIYRVGILMYGKKTTFKELYKWITYKS
ncbi:MAG: ABC transporter permease [Pedobacter sp.]|nr:MAG: ABC transporter permease [Pedobacter sp.]